MRPWDGKLFERPFEQVHALPGRIFELVFDTDVIVASPFVVP